MTIKLVTLKTTHTLISDIDCVSDTEISIKQPLQVVMQQTKDGPVVSFAPFLEYSEEFKVGIKMPMSDVLCITTPVIELQNQYNQIFGSGIQIASAIPKL